MTSNKYDEGYLRAIKSRCSGYNGAFNDSETQGAVYAQGYQDAFGLRDRDPKKSALAQDAKYQAFLQMITQALGPNHEEYIQVSWSTGGKSGSWRGKERFLAEILHKNC